ncbi:MAG: hypothetical protein HY842_17890 [Bacteroidetes bacterium]|nr:hypothetical protein [Bacteroidota bacterium]
MKRISTVFFIAVLFQFLQAQNPTFLFNVHTPTPIVNSYQSGEFSSIITGSWGWDGTVGAPVIGELAYAEVDGTGLHTFCEPDAVDYANKIVLIDRGACEFGKKALHAQDQGAIGVVIINFDSSSLIAMQAGAFGEQVFVPVIMVPFGLGESLKNEMTLGNTVVVSFANGPINFARIDGKVVFDENDNCIADTGEAPMAGWQVKAENSSITRYAHTKADGTYRLYVEPGNYTFSADPFSPYLVLCSDSLNVSLPQPDSIVVDFEAQPIVDCPQIEVDIETPFMRRCFDNYYTLNWCNIGSATAEDAYITLKFDDSLEVIDVSLPFTYLGNNTLEFQLGDVGVGQCGSIDITAYLPCGVEWDKTICAVAEAFPSEPCPLPGSLWSGANVRVGGECSNNETVIFTVSNIGTGDMADSASYVVLKNGLYFDDGKFRLAAGISQIFSYDDTDEGATFRFEASQESGFPYPTAPGSTVEGCSFGNWLYPGYALMFPPADYGPSYDEECMEVIGSYDPNDKTGFPKGWEDEHLIAQNTDIQYLIRFQNTGTDVAFNVVVRDTLTDLLDLSSIRLGVSSHPFEFAVKHGNVLEFSFKDIMLPDSFANEPASHGFLNFTVSQKTDLPFGSIISNKAAIYFDFNDPVITNETWHKIGNPYLWSATTQVWWPGLKVTVSPNPMASATIFYLDGAEFQVGTIELFDTAGKLLRVEEFDTTHFDFRRNGLPTGSFIFKITLDGRSAVTGLLVVSY